MKLKIAIFTAVKYFFVKGEDNTETYTSSNQQIWL